MRWARTGPALGIGSWVLILGGLITHGYPEMGASGPELGRWGGVV